MGNKGLAMVDIAKKLLIVEDDPGMQKQLRWCFEGFEVFIAGDRKKAIEYMDNQAPAVVTLDLGLPPDADGVSEGFATLEQILAARSSTKVIMITGSEGREHALKAISIGAYDFYQKPVDSDIIKTIVDRAYQVYALEQENLSLIKRNDASPLPGIIAASSEMLKVCREIEKVAPVNVTTLLFGESGTGKELLAKAIHHLSDRAKGPFVAINCAAIPENLLESELFGYEKGAFTGAVKRTLGKIEGANGGTLMLDEIGDLPASLQSKLLRFLQERTIERLGGREEIPVDVRIIAASHRDLKALINTGNFREDLYYRLSEITITVPPLRQRTGDAIAIAYILLDRFAKEQGRKVPKLSAEAIEAIQSYYWPGNIRELENRIKRATVMSDGKVLSASDFELTGNRENMDLSLKTARELAERKAVEQALNMGEGKIAKAAKLLDISRPTLYDLMSKYQLK